MLYLAQSKAGGPECVGGRRAHRAEWDGRRERMAVHGVCGQRRTKGIKIQSSLILTKYLGAVRNYHWSITDDLAMSG